MLTRIEIDGFKSLQNFSLDLEPFMAIVGVNGAGKSNLFDAMALLSRLASMPVREALKAGRGHIRDQFSLTKDGHVSKMTFAVELLLPKTVTLPLGKTAQVVRTRVRYELELERLVAQGSIEVVAITQELLLLLTRENDLWLSKHPHFEQPRYSEDTPSTLLRLKTQNTSESLNSAWFEPRSLGPGIDQASIQIAKSLESALHENHRDKPLVLAQELSRLLIVQATQQALQSCRFSQVEPSRLRATSEAADATTLARDGSNLPTVFAALSPEVKGRVRANVVRFVPGLRDVEAKQRDDEFYLEVTSTDGRRFPARILSDGTLRILALLTLLYSSPAGSLIAIEELENGIYPGRFVDLLETLVEATSPEANGLQILLTSHSPTVIAALKEKSRALAFIDTVSIAGQRVTRVRQMQDAPTDRGATSISRQEVEQILEVSQPEGL
jgi:predicted ATPase